MPWWVNSATWLPQLQIWNCDTVPGVLCISSATPRQPPRLNNQRWLVPRASRRWRIYPVTSQEEQMINSLIERVNSTQLTEKDPEAARLLEDGFKSNKDAVYILAQSVLVQNIALEQARAQLNDAQQQLAQQSQQPAKASSFLGNLLGHRDPATPPPLPPQYRQQGQYQQVYSPESQYQQAPQYQAPPYQGQPYPPPAYGQQYVPQQPSFLRSAAQTAAGVAAGALAFEGVESLLHGGFGHPGIGMGMGGWGMPGVGMGMGYERPIEETVVNNYYDSPGGGEREHEHFRDSGDYDREDSRLSDASWSDSASTGYDGGGGSFDDSSSFGDSGGNSGNDDGIL